MFQPPKEPTMNTPSLTVRLISATIAAVTTFGLLSAVFSIAEPQRSVLIAKMERSEKMQSAPVALAMASDSIANNRK
jgi:hypothetical protein